jgi:site-specific DNA recombinase
MSTHTDTNTLAADTGQLRDKLSAVDVNVLLVDGPGEQVALNAERRARRVTVMARDEWATAGNQLLRQSIASWQRWPESWDRDEFRRRLTKGKRDKAELLGQVVGLGPPPFGYRYVRAMVGKKERTVGLELDAETAPIVRRIFRDLLRTSTQEVCDGLNAERLVAPRGGRWTVATMLGMLDNPCYLGTYQYGRYRYENRPSKKSRVKYEREAGEAASIPVPPLATVEELRAIREALTERKYLRSGRLHQAGVDPYELRGLLTCGSCHGVLATVTGGKGRGRYYICLRTHPNRAAIQDKPCCTLPGIRAERLEAHAWAVVSRTLLDPEYLRAGIAKAREANTAVQRRREQIKHLRAEIEKREKALDRQVVELLKIEEGSPLEASLRRAGAELEAEVKHLRTEAAELEAMPVDGLSDDDADALQQFAAQVSDGLGEADTQTRRRVYELLRLRATVTEDPENGIELAQSRSFSIEWRAVVVIATGASSSTR